MAHPVSGAVREVCWGHSLPRLTSCSLSQPRELGECQGAPWRWRPPAESDTLKERCLKRPSHHLVAIGRALLPEMKWLYQGPQNMQSAQGESTIV
jgi:hypothetical protein